MKTESMEKGYRQLTVPEAAGIIEKAESALIVCHRNPDADTVGSALALREIFLLLGKRAVCACESEIPAHLDFLSRGNIEIYTEGFENGFGTVITVDVASPSQLGKALPLAEKTQLMIDHHSSGTPFADNLIVSDASAAGEIIFKLYSFFREKNVVPESPRAARYIFAAISGDTGSFKYSNVTPETFLAAAELCRMINCAEDGGMKTDEISRFLHDTVTKREAEINRAVSGTLELFENGTLGICCVSRRLMEKEGFTEAEAGAAVDIPRKIKGVLVAVALKQMSDEECSFRISARANADIDVAAVCSKYFSGGGHVRAAGGKIEAKSESEAVFTVRKAFSDAISEYLKNGRTGDTLL